MKNIIFPFLLITVSIAFLSCAVSEPNIGAIRIENCLTNLNGNDATISVFNISQASDGALWSENLLGNIELIPGEYFTASNIIVGYYNLKAVDANDKPYTIADVLVEKDKTFVWIIIEEE